MPRIFISYRRADSIAVAGSIRRDLEEAFGKDSVFMDVERIPPGEDFRAYLARWVNSCDVLLAIIGPSWLNITDKDGNRRLDNEADFVRIEIENALAREDVLVIPVLVGGAAPPPADALPPSLRPLAFRNAIPVRYDPDYDRDMDKLVRHLRRHFAERAREQRQTRLASLPWRWIAALLLIAVLLMGLMSLWGSGDGDDAPPGTLNAAQLEGTASAMRTTETAAAWTNTPTSTPTITPEPTNTPIPTPEPSNTPQPTPKPSDTPLPTDTPTATPTITPEPTYAPTDTPRPTAPSVPDIDPGATPIPVGSNNAAWTPVLDDSGPVPLVYVPSGCFMMGSTDEQIAYAVNELGANPDWVENEQPAHEVCLSAFWIGQTEVTNAQYRHCVEAGACSPPGNTQYYDREAYADHPVVNVSWNDASAYVEWLSGETGQDWGLPTEAQWEYAARGPEAWLYPWGDDGPTCEQAQIAGCEGDTVSVGSLPGGQSWAGALEMSGNVWEWVADWYDAGYYGTLAERVVNPMGPERGDYRVLRGGSFSSTTYLLRAALRNRSAPDLVDNLNGFRCARSAEG